MDLKMIKFSSEKTFFRVNISASKPSEGFFPFGILATIFVYN